ncbi:DUF6415 family natural product biosynthesis protein [Streptomyces gamaensis]|uniref:DUF6415 family natural product biosynthesis protein n=1 Tax=Streptomyces gamaensis TaxID=1763542 RepID=A0ABW0Z8B6_9ACTN
MCGLSVAPGIGEITAFLLDRDETAHPAPEELRDWTGQLTKALNRSIRCVAEAAAQLPTARPERTQALAAADKAAHRLRTGPGNGAEAALAYAMGLASDVRALREHRRVLDAEAYGQHAARKEKLSERVAAANALSRRFPR